MTFHIYIRYSYSTQLSNHSQMDIQYSINKLPSNDIPDGYSLVDIQYSNIKNPADNLPDGYLIFECQTCI